MKIDSRQATILIVDDEPENLNVLEALLTLVGYRVSAFPRGEMALVAASEELPDLVLLDIRMPWMDGYEVCRRFKADARLRQIPIIFLSAFSDHSDKLRAFEVGGVDYVLKPFAEVEVLARVNTHLRLSRHRLDLEELDAQRVEELAEAHRRLEVRDGTKNPWFSVLSHEMRAPLSGLLGISERLFLDLPAKSAHHSMRVEYDRYSKRLEKLIDDALALARLDVEAADLALRPVPLAQVLRNALSALAGQAPGIDVLSALDAVEEVTVMGEPELLLRAFIDLLLTATRCVAAGQALSVTTRLTDGRAKVTLLTSGKTLSAQALDTFFEVGGQPLLLPDDSGDLGLGAALGSRVIRLAKGWVSVRNGAQQGLVIEISLPANPPHASPSRRLN
jgi:DNA-binding response OmpR family regulator